MEWAKNVACMRIMFGAKTRRTTRRQRCAWEDNINLDFREIGWSDMDWINLAQNRDQ
jgi:hypothetical protein